MLLQGNIQRWSCLQRYCERKRRRGWRKLWLEFSLPSSHQDKFRLHIANVGALGWGFQTENLVTLRSWSCLSCSGSLLNKDSSWTRDSSQTRDPSPTALQRFEHIPLQWGGPLFLLLQHMSHRANTPFIKEKNVRGTQAVTAAGCKQEQQAQTEVEEHPRCTRSTATTHGVPSQVAYLE